MVQTDSIYRRTRRRLGLSGWPGEREGGTASPHCTALFGSSSEDESNNRTTGLPTPVMNSTNLVPVILPAKLKTTTSSTKRLLTIKKYRERNKT